MNEETTNEFLSTADQCASDAIDMPAPPPAEMERRFAVLAQAAAAERIAAALESLNAKLDGLTSAAGNLKVETPS